MENKTKKPENKLDDSGKILLEELSHPSLSLKPGGKPKKGSALLIRYWLSLQDWSSGNFNHFHISRSLCRVESVIFAGLAAAWEL